MGRLSKAARIAKAVTYVVVLAGLLFFALDLYSTQSGWSVHLAEPPKVAPLGTSLEITAPLVIHNPSHSRIIAKLLWYTVYLGGEPVGQGTIPYLVLKPGDNRVNLRLRVDIVHLPCAVVEALSGGNRLGVEVRGYTTVTLMLFGRVGYRDLLVPFNTTVYAVDVRLPEPAKAALRLASLLCSAPSSLPFKLP